MSLKQESFGKVKETWYGRLFYKMIKIVVT
jgi:hypothetical protein